ncbi:efflux RND transporter periplasmic adaptor subunit [Paenibacillus ginsengarvi]|uniref:Efflux RND transporter periplasmic adaptor subunit n=1 Tax=Paenibacillus ginsengarvi TaxID=400777 RepID=A0A3B0CTB5_9BACL|nr:efflux RND transporter periplasmic adaptor subunit [Paenibacillus ginsengarvi]RKN86828.1 efflux RND transporter periplasmic adaptor subunit [Paenibacillus ginsengarvi]
MFTKWWTENSSIHKTMLAIALTVSLTAASGCSLLPKEEEEEVLPAIAPPKLSEKPVYEVKTTTLETKQRGAGRLLSTKEETLYFTQEDTKRLKDIYVKTGDAVKAGQLIAELDVTTLENDLRQKRLQQRSEELHMIELLRKNDGSKSAEELEQAKIAFELKKEELGKLEQSIASAKLTAPFDGTIVSVAVKKGDNIKGYDDIAVLADLNSLTVAAELSADDLKKVAIGMEVIVDINSAGQHKGTVAQLPLPKTENNGQGPMAPGQQKDSIDKYLLVALNPFPEGLKRGTPLSVSVISQRKENAIVIPAAALRSYSGRNYVQVVDEKGAKREVDVEIGQQTSTEVEIVKGLQPGQKVVGR